MDPHWSALAKDLTTLKRQVIHTKSDQAGRHTISGHPTFLVRHRDLLNIHVSRATREKSSPEPRWPTWWSWLTDNERHHFLFPPFSGYMRSFSFILPLFVVIFLIPWRPSISQDESSSWVICHVMEGWTNTRISPPEPWLAVMWRAPT